MRKIFTLTITIILLAMFATTSYANDSFYSDITTLGNGDYYETIIETTYNESPSTSFVVFALNSTKTGSKTTYYKNSKGEIMWYVKVNGTFTYGGGSATCTSSSVTAESKNANWKITSKSASKTANKAKATATAKQYLNGTAVGTLTKSVTLTCSTTGQLS